ncbi:MAG: sigma-70 family RNA polymerase sigma factor [Planctomycetes bacterium]|nr:sigma-70 family RNA polymerase sigma factor [Planctomycetota bacterium]
MAAQQARSLDLAEHLLRVVAPDRQQRQRHVLSTSTVVPPRPTTHAAVQGWQPSWAVPGVDGGWATGIAGFFPYIAGCPGIHRAPMLPTDVQLFRRYVTAADRAALDELFGRHYPAVHRVAARLLPEPADAADVAQSTFLAAIRAGDSAPPTDSFRAWLLAIAVNEVRQFLRTKRRQRRDPLAEVVCPAPDDLVPDAAARREFERALEDAMRLLPQHLKEPVALHFYESMPLADVGAVLGLPKSTVQTRVAIAVERLRRHLRRSGHAALVPLFDARITIPAPANAASGLLHLLAWIMSAKLPVVAGVAIFVAGLLALVAIWPPAPPIEQRTSANAPDGASASPLLPVSEPGAPEQVPDARTAAGEAAHEVFGLVLREGGEPVAEATVRLFDYTADHTEMVLTDTDGRFRFAGTRDRDGVFHLTAEKPGSGRCTAADVTASVQPLRCILQSGLIIRGGVVDAVGGAPVASFTVEAVRLPFQREADWDPALVLHRQSLPANLLVDRRVEVVDPNGRFELSDLEAGRYVLVVTTEGRQSTFFAAGGRSWDRFAGVEALPRAAASEHTIVLPAPGHVVVQAIAAANGTPIAGATVRLHCTFGDLALPCTATTTDGDGRAVVPVALDARGRIDDVALTVSAPGLAAASTSFGGQENGCTVAVALPRPAALHGRVLGADGEPVPGATILVERVVDRTLLGRARSDLDGRYAIDGLNAVSATTLHCLSPALDHVVATLPLQLDDGETRYLDIDLRGSAGVVGKVAVGGVPAVGALVVMHAERGGIRVDCTTRRDGAYAFASLPSGRYDVTVTAVGFGRQLAARAPIEIGLAMQRRDFDFAHRLTGRVVALAAGGKEAPPVEGADVVATHLADQTTIEVEAAADGSFAVLLSAPGPWELHAQRGDETFPVRPQRIEVRDAAEIDGVELLFAADPADGRIELRFVDARSGAPVNGELRFSHGRSQTAASFANGVFVEEKALLGRYRFTATSAEHRPTPFEVELLPGQREVVLSVPLAAASEVEITEVAPGSPAHRAGLRVGDRPRRYGGTAIHSTAGLRAAIDAQRGPTTFVVLRDGGELAVPVPGGTLGIAVENVR